MPGSLRPRVQAELASEGAADGFLVASRNAASDWPAFDASNSCSVIPGLP